MKTILQACLTGVFTLCAGAVVTAGIAQAQASSSQTTSLPSEMPEHLQPPVTDSFDYIKRDVMIPMRDGVRLHTVIVIPKGAKHAPILLTRTPYNATGQTSHAASSHLGSILYGYDNALETMLSVVAERAKALQPSSITWMSRWPS